MAKRKNRSIKKEAIVLFSGGKDSFLSVCMLIEQGFKVFMVNFKTIASIGDSNALSGAQRIIDRYGEDKVSFLGIFSIAGILRELLLPFLNIKQRDILENYGDMTYSQFNCLACRSAMYAWTVLKAQEMGVHCVGDGARKIQGFVIELPIMIDAFSSFFREFSIEFVCPVLNLESDWLLKNYLLARGFLSKTWESQCLLGVPLPGGKTPDEDVQKATLVCFEKLILPKCRQLIRDKFPITAEESYL